MNIRLEQFELNTETQWQQYMKIQNDYLQEVCNEEEYKESLQYVTSSEYKNNILTVINRNENKFYVQKIIKDNLFIGFVDYICYLDEGGKGLIGNFFIYPQYRNMGAGSKVYKIVEERLKQLGCKYIELTPEDKAISLYKRMGYFDTGKISEENGINIYRKNLLK